ncbi:MAG: hypothetical protein QOJ79_901 [Actinomycetota bacterium]|jgi:hypothetical protein|nr:hypothetical protein [Actinomycetota bacterium]
MRRIAVVIALLVLLAGCGGGGESAGSGAMSKAAGADAKAAPPAGTSEQVKPVVDKAKPVTVPRSLIRTAQLQVRVDDVKKAAAEAEQTVEAAGGERSDEQLDLQASHPTASLQLLVPPARLGTSLSRLSALGEELSRRLGTDDVTDEVVDLDSRLATQRTSVARVRALLDQAGNLNDVVRIEAELSRREADLESLQQRVRAISGQVAMSEITLSLTSQAPKPKPKLATTIGFTSGLNGGWHAFTAAARVAAAAVGALLPFLPVLAVVIGGALWWRRRVAAA